MAYIIGQLIGLGILALIIISVISHFKKSK